MLRPRFLHKSGMCPAFLVTVTGRLPGIYGRQALAVRCLATANARGRILVIADGWARRWLRGEPFPLDIPWTPC